MSKVKSCHTLKYMYIDKYGSCQRPQYHSTLYRVILIPCYFHNSTLTDGFIPKFTQTQVCQKRYKRKNCFVQFYIHPLTMTVKGAKAKQG